LVVEIQAGEGGDDSKLFVSDLLAAYVKYARSQNLKAEILETGDGSATLGVQGQGVWKAFRHEPGIHCVQRVPPTESRGRWQTSMLSVAVLPVLDRSFEPIPESEIEVKTQGGHGPGGQHQNKTESAVRVTHIPTKMTVFINGRSQHRNKLEAIRILTARVNRARLMAREAAHDADRRSQMGSGGRGAKVRTYNFIKHRAVDHRLGTKTNQVERVIGRGEFDLLIG
jgi:peptide chain release factor 1